jgi:O-antigen ligase
VVTFDKARQQALFPYWLLVSFLVLVFLTGGASRYDVASLLILKPAAMLVCAAALATMRREHWHGRRWLVFLIAAFLGLNLLHLVPLPPSIWQSLPGRDAIAETDRLVGLGDVWRPLTLTPMNGWHSLTSLFVPLAVLLLAVQLNRAELFRLLPWLIGLGLLSGLVGMMQVAGGSQGPLYLYQITNHGSAVGLFSNRNHAAVLLAILLPMLALHAATTEGTMDRQRARLFASVAAAVVLLPLVLVTGSRAGLFATVFGLFAAWFLYRRPQQGRAVRSANRKVQRNLLLVLAGAVLAGVTVLTVVFARAEALRRVLEPTPADGARGNYWKVSMDLFWQHFPVGSGAGSFVEVFEGIEPEKLLDLTYTNHAHNDWLEISLVYGLPGMLLLAFFLLLFVRRAAALLRRGKDSTRAEDFGKLATIIIVILGAASIPDYPLRTPIMMSVFAISLLWFTASRDEGAPVVTVAEA